VVPPSPNIVKCCPQRCSANPLVRGLPLVNRDLLVRPNHIILLTSSLLWGVLCQQVRLSAPPPGRGGRVGPVVPILGDGGECWPWRRPWCWIWGFPQPRPRAGSQDRPVPLPVDPLVEACHGSCPTCNFRICSVPVPLICQCCRAQYHKQARCSGLTLGALDV
jgi:hypothetical protein